MGSDYKCHSMKAHAFKSLFVEVGSRLFDLGLHPETLPAPLYDGFIEGELMLVSFDKWHSFTFCPATKKNLERLFLRTV